MSKETWEHIKSLKEDFINGDAIAMIWTTEDVLGCEDGTAKISEKEAQEVLGILDRKHDASLGISWDTISCYIDEIIHDRIEKGE